MMNCGHSFCSSCLLNLMPKKAMDAESLTTECSIQCPSCYKTIMFEKDPSCDSIEESWLSNLVKNFSLIQLVDSNNREKRKQVTFREDPSFISDTVYETTDNGTEMSINDTSRNTWTNFDLLKSGEKTLDVDLMEEIGPPVIEIG